MNILPTITSTSRKRGQTRRKRVAALVVKVRAEDCIDDEARSHESP